MNVVTITGRLTKDPELAERGGSTVCDLRIAENGGRDDAAPLYVDVAVFRRQAEVCARHLSKGRLVGITGRLRYSEWEAEDGSKRSRHSVVAQRVEFLDAKPGGEPTAAVSDEEASEPVGVEF
jgi:single-strand DNA-binding protein